MSCFVILSEALASGSVDVPDGDPTIASSPANLDLPCGPSWLLESARTAKRGYTQKKRTGRREFVEAPQGHFAATVLGVFGE